MVFVRRLIVANKEHIQPLLEAIASMSMASWNHWRIENPSIRPDLSEVKLPDTNMSFAYLTYADLSYADLSRTNLHHATLRHTDLSSTGLQKADLGEADLSYSILQGADLSGAVLRDTKLCGADLRGACFKDADLRGADLTNALLDSNAVEGQKKWFSGGISRLEKLALGIFARAKGKDHQLLDGGTKPRRFGRRI
jgi:uncharacterized protein YjbI with pentapeptide repeats